MRSPRPSLPVLIGLVLLVAIALGRSEDLRERALAGLGRGMPAREAELARGFVLGADDGIDPRTEEDFRRAGLAHLLAVSGQNVTLLALLAMPLLAAFGIPLRERLLWVLGLIAVYVALAGAEPSIQRAAVMGAAGLIATLAGRRASRLFALAAALLVTLAVDPGIAAEVGWQLSFAAVTGIFVFATPIRRAITGRIGDGEPWRALAEGAAVTVAATLATAPLVAFHFETFSTVTLLANLLALPAVAPAMWLGMAGAAASQVPGLPVEAFNAPNALLLAYIAQVAAWCGRPQWAEVGVSLGGAGLAAAYAALAAGTVVAFGWRRRRRLRAAAARAEGARTRARRGRGAQPVALGLALLGALVLFAPGSAAVPRELRGLRVTVLDVGQGDAILLQPAAAPAVLVDGGPPGGGLEAALEGAGVERLAAAVVTHDQADHVGGVEELLGRFPVRRLIYARLDAGARSLSRAAGVPAVRVAAGAELRSGALRLEVLWPPPELLAGGGPVDDPNRLSLVLLARWHDFSMLLTADAEAEAVPIVPGPVDVLKVAHHGSEDEGLAGLLQRTGPALAVISAGADNPYGHPTAATLAALEARGVRTLRTDRDGAIGIEVRPGALAITTQD
ncbi:MAG TPA: ComEC/Rec2 family competence protein [Solirubrobacterales bacterium]|nr:ComEC/Rec2 family competence protein [Solirubrobacterales bacterium]